jgi:branched-chain amino acid transport system substrate-binding protein
MSLFRRFTLLTLALTLCLGLGCSRDVKIGAVISESGSVSFYGEQVRKGMDLAVKELNLSGGVNGGMVQLIYKDDATNADRGQQVVQELIEVEDVDMIIGAISSKVTLRIAPICEEQGVVLLSPASSAPSISDAGDYIFRNYPSDILEGTAMARFAKDEGFERVVIFALDNAFGHGLTEVFTEEYESKYRQVVKTFFFAEGATDGFDAMVEEARGLDPDGAYVIAYYQELPAVLQAIHAADLNVVVMGTSSVPPTIAQNAGEAAEKLLYPQPAFDPGSGDARVIKFVQDFKQTYGEDPEIYAAHGYDAVMLMAEAIRELGSTHPANVKIGLSSIKNYNGAAGPTTFDKNGDVVRYPRLFIIHEGRAIPYKQFTDEGLSLFERRG